MIVLGVTTLNLSPEFKYKAFGIYKCPYPGLDAKPYTEVNISSALVEYHDVTFASIVLYVITELPVPPNNIKLRL